MTLPLLAAGALALLGAAVHGARGEALVIRQLDAGSLPSSPFGGPRMTMAMIHASWHLTTVAFLATGVALVAAGVALDGDARRTVAVLAAATMSGFAAVVVGLGAAHLRSLRDMLRHPAPVVLTGAAALAWWGAL